MGTSVKQPVVGRLYRIQINDYDCRSYCGSLPDPGSIPGVSKIAMTLTDTQIHGIPATGTREVYCGVVVKRLNGIPVITPEIAEALHQEMQGIREEFNKRVQKMYVIPLEQRFAKSR